MSIIGFSLQPVLHSYVKGPSKHRDRSSLDLNKFTSQKELSHCLTPLVNGDKVTFSL